MQRTWSDLQGGNWADANAWSPTGVPAPGDAARISQPGSYVVVIDQPETVAQLELDDAAAVLSVIQPSSTPATSLGITGGLTLDAGTVELAGQVSGAVGAGGCTYTVNAAVMLDLSGGINTGSASPGAGAVTATVAALDFIGGQTLDNATLFLGDSVALLASAGTLTLGSGFVLDQTGSLDTMDGAIVNAGRIDFAGGPWVRIGASQPGDFTNSGTITIGAEQVLATTRNFSNSGFAEIAGVFDLTVQGSYANSGTIAIAPGGAFALTADTSLSGLGRIDNAGGLIGIGGTLDLGSGTLDAVTYDGTLNLSTLGSLTTLSVADGLAVTGGTIDVTGVGDALQFLDNETLDNVVLNIGGASGGDAYLVGDPSGTLTLGANAVLNQPGGQAYFSANTVVNQGRIEAERGALSISGSSFANSGTMVLSGAGTSVVVQANTLANSGSIAIGAGDTLVLQAVTFNALPPPAGFANTGAIGVSPGGALVVDLETTLAALGSIGGSGGTLEIAPRQAWYSSDTGGVLDLGGGTLVIGAGSPFSDLIVDGTIENGTVLVKPGGTFDPPAGGTELNVVEAPCYLAGTRLKTARGEIAVERLGIGDQVVTASGEARPIVWIGQRRIDCRRHPRPDLVWPIRIRAGAFGPAAPRRDLWLSPDHAVRSPAAPGGGKCVLIPVRHLVNGLTIVQEPAASVRYFHVELAAHDILLAEGLTVESYLDTGNRAMFANGDAHVALHPDFAPLRWEDACAPLCLGGAELAAARRLLVERAGSLGWRATSPAGLHLLANGRAIAPASVKGGLFRFLLAEGTSAIGIVSHSGVPARLDPASREWRRLGLRIAGIMVNGRPVALESPLLRGGFYPCERRGAAEWRWTDGAAELSLPASRGRIVLELLVLPGQGGLAGEPEVLSWPKGAKLR